jgi:hypothetical protein
MLSFYGAQSGSQSRETGGSSQTGSIRKVGTRF